MRKTCEADMYVPASSHGTDHIRLGHAEEVPWMFMFLSKEQDIDDMVGSSEASLMHDPERPIPKEWRLNYQRHRRGPLKSEDHEAAQCPDRLVFHPNYARFREDTGDDGQARDMRVRVDTPTLGDVHRDVRYFESQSTRGARCWFWRRACMREEGLIKDLANQSSIMKGWKSSVNPDLVFPDKVGERRPSFTDAAKNDPEAEPY
eukprot:10866078-Alexandrium_andersonii.AAC.1